MQDYLGVSSDSDSEDTNWKTAWDDIHDPLSTTIEQTLETYPFARTDLNLALVRAVAKGHVRTAKLLLAHGALDVDVDDLNLFRGHSLSPRILQDLINHGVPIDILHGQFNDITSTFYNCRWFNDFVKWRMEHEADTEESESSLQLSFAVGQNSQVAAEVLINNGAKVTSLVVYSAIGRCMSNPRSSSPYGSCKAYAPERLRWLLENVHKSELSSLMNEEFSFTSARFSIFRSPLHCAVTHGGHAKELVQVLLDFGADAQLKDSKGFTAAQWARKWDKTHGLKLYNQITGYQRRVGVGGAEDDSG